MSPASPLFKSVESVKLFFNSKTYFPCLSFLRTSSYVDNETSKRSNILFILENDEITSSQKKQMDNHGKVYESLIQGKMMFCLLDLNPKVIITRDPNCSISKAEFPEEFEQLNLDYNIFQSYENTKFNKYNEIEIDLIISIDMNGEERIKIPYLLSFNAPQVKYLEITPKSQKVHIFIEAFVNPFDFRKKIVQLEKITQLVTKISKIQNCKRKFEGEHLFAFITNSDSETAKKLYMREISNLVLLSKATQILINKKEFEFKYQKLDEIHRNFDHIELEDSKSYLCNAYKNNQLFYIYCMDDLIESLFQIPVLNKNIQDLKMEVKLNKEKSCEMAKEIEILNEKGTKNLIKNTIRFDEKNKY